MPEEPYSYGEVAYNAYGDYRDWKVFDGKPMPQWEDQHEELKEAWERAALAVRKLVEKDKRST